MWELIQISVLTLILGVTAWWIGATAAQTQRVNYIEVRIK